MTNVGRRHVLGGVAAVSSLLAGCVDSSGSDLKDSDGDGVIDSEDYAPNDPEVQRKSDILKSATPTMTPTATPTATTSPTPSTTSPAAETLTPTAETTNRIEATSPEKLGGSYISSYTATSATVTLDPESLSISSSELKLVVVTYEYPNGEGVALGTSEPFERPGRSVERTVTVTDGSVPEDTRVHHNVFAMDGEESIDTAQSGDIEFVHETDAFTRRGADQIVRDPPAYELNDASTTAFERTAIEGAYLLHLEGRTQGYDWWVEWYIWKSAYAEAIDQPRGRSYAEYVTYALTNGNATTLAGIFHEQAVDLGFTDKRTQAEFVIDLIQRLPYVTDDVSKGFDDYPKTVIETITEASGDCEDTAILTAAVLSAEPFGYDTVLIQFSDHMGAGVYGTDLPGYYWTYDSRDYYYVETTGEGWGVGDLPDTYQDTDAYVYQV